MILSKKTLTSLLEFPTLPESQDRPPTAEEISHRGDCARDTGSEQLSIQSAVVKLLSLDEHELPKAGRGTGGSKAVGISFPLLTLRVRSLRRDC